MNFWTNRIRVYEHFEYEFWTNRMSFEKIDWLLNKSKKFWTNRMSFEQIEWVLNKSKSFWKDLIRVLNKSNKGFWKNQIRVFEKSNKGFWTNRRGFNRSNTSFEQIEYGFLNKSNKIFCTNWTRVFNKSNTSLWTDRKWTKYFLNKCKDLFFCAEGTLKLALRGKYFEIGRTNLGIILKNCTLCVFIYLQKWSCCTCSMIFILILFLFCFSWSHFSYLQILLSLFYSFFSFKYCVFSFWILSFRLCFDFVYK